MIKDSDGSVVACHPTKEKANAHMTALYAQEGNMTPRHEFVAQVRDVELRTSGNGKDITMTGYAAVFDSWSAELHTFAGSFKERIDKGAFRNVLDHDPDVRLLFNHNEDMPLARTKSGTLELTEDDKGLRVAARMAPTSYANDLRVAMERGDVDQMSFAFTVADKGDTWNDSNPDEITRTITEIGQLYDVSVVTYPAYPDTEAAVREIRAALEAGRIDRGAIAYKATPAASEGTSWDANAQMTACKNGQDYRAICAWVDSSGDPEQRSSYKFPHHMASGEHPVVWAGVSAGMQRLMGSSIPDGDKRGVYNHLSKHYSQFGKEPPAWDDLQRSFRVASAETDPADEETPPDTAPATDPVDADGADGAAGPETDALDAGTQEESSLDRLRAETRQTLIDERRKYARLLREISR